MDVREGYLTADLYLYQYLLYTLWPGWAVHINEAGRLFPLLHLDCWT